MSEAILHLSIPVTDLVASRRFYVEVLGCRPGRHRADFVDVWFFGLQLTLQQRPEDVRPVAEQGSRHFGVALLDERQFEQIYARLRSTGGVHWLTPLTQHPGETLSGKTEFKIADPSGNVIEFKHYRDPTEFLALDA
ncbi:MAG TPA: VOC family protein [Acidimicrobiales bacterium]